VAGRTAEALERLAGVLEDLQRTEEHLGLGSGQDAARQSVQIAGVQAVRTTLRPPLLVDSGPDVLPPLPPHPAFLPGRVNTAILPDR
jgi:hypothetical protein